MLKRWIRIAQVQAVGMALAFGVDLCGGQEDSVEPPAPEVVANEPQHPEKAASTVDVLFFGETSPAIVRFHLQLDGRPLADVWQESRAATFAFLDADASGELTAQETRRYPWTAQQRRENTSMLSSLFSRFRSTSNGNGDAQRGGMSRERFDEQYAFVRPVMLVAPSAAGGAASDLFELADADGDKRLSEKELSELAGRAGVLDIDGDGSISEQEISQYDNPFSRQQELYAGNQPAAQPSLETAIWVSLADAGSHSPLALRLVEHYSRSSSLGEATVEAALTASLRAADAAGDANGRVDTFEAEAMLRSPTPDIEITLRLGESGEQAPLEAIANLFAQGAAQGTVRVDSVVGGGAALTLGAERCELATTNLSGVNYAETYKQQFEAADVDNNNYVDEAESRNNGYLSASFARMDRDADGKLFLEELTNYIEQESASAATRLVLTYRIKGRTLFALLDDNADNRLSRRELEAAPEKIALFDADGDGVLSHGEIPRSFRLVVDRGQPDGLFAAFNPAATPATAPVEAAGPKWFRLSDRNRDGELSWNEFRGTRELFERLDANRDGAIDAREAAAE